MPGEPIPEAHPTAAELLQFAAARLPPEPYAKIHQHVAGCETCRRALLALPDQSTTLGQKSAPPSEQANLEPGAMVGRYQILERVGAGAMGVVYAAYDPELHRKLALKVLKAQADPSGSSEGRTRLLLEAQALAQLSHPNVVEVHDVGVHDEQLFIAMEFVEGTTLREWVAKKEPPWKQTLQVFKQAARGLAAAHAAGLVHRDFKPENVLVGADGRVRVTDFGLVRTSGAQEEPGANGRVTRPGAMVGTPAYMAPEQLLGPGAVPESDQFAFCVALFEALHGERPFRAKSVGEAVLAIHRREIVHCPPGRVPAWLDRVIRRGLRANPSDRHPSLAQLVRMLMEGEDRHDVRRITGLRFVFPLLWLAVSLARHTETWVAPLAVWAAAIALLLVGERYSAVVRRYARFSAAVVETPIAYWLLHVAMAQAPGSDWAGRVAVFGSATFVAIIAISMMWQEPIVVGCITALATVLELAALREVPSLSVGGMVIVVAPIVTVGLIGTVGARRARRFVKPA